MSQSSIVPVILAGGQGTRLWPMSRASRPKQFLPLLGPRSLFQETLLRVADRELYGPPLVVSNAEYRFLVAEQAQEAGVTLTASLLEPVPRGTLPAIAAAAVQAERTVGSAALLHVLPSDHAVSIDEGYRSAVEAAAGAAHEGRLVTFGIVPTAPETGYGYIEAGKGPGPILPVRRFLEKPDRATAEAFLAEGGFYWNSGMFMLEVKTFLAECRRLAPQVAEAARRAVENAAADLDFIRLDPESFAAAPAISIDYAIFEKTDRAVVVPVSFPWSDLGSWDAVWKAGTRDAADNLATGPVTLSNTSGSLVISDRAHLAVEGLEGMLVVASDDAVYAGRLSEAQRVGEVVKRLRADAATLPLTETDRTAHRPWGGYTAILDGERFKVKRLFVKPGRRLSLQRHHHRSEHWVVVRGTAQVTIGETTRAVAENESVHIPRGEVHRLANPGRIVLEVIEVQTGSYLGEDDIIRIEDEFGRT